MMTLKRAAEHCTEVPPAVLAIGDLAYLASGSECAEEKCGEVHGNTAGPRQSMRPAHNCWPGNCTESNVLSMHDIFEDGSIGTAPKCEVKSHSTWGAYHAVVRAATRRRKRRRERERERVGGIQRAK